MVDYEKEIGEINHPTAVNDYFHRQIKWARNFDTADKLYGLCHDKMKSFGIGTGTSLLKYYYINFLNTKMVEARDLPKFYPLARYNETFKRIVRDTAKGLSLAGKDDVKEKESILTKAENGLRLAYDELIVGFSFREIADFGGFVCSKLEDAIGTSVTSETDRLYTEISNALEYMEKNGVYNLKGFEINDIGPTRNQLLWNNEG